MPTPLPPSRRSVRTPSQAPASEPPARRFQAAATGRAALVALLALLHPAWAPSPAGAQPSPTQEPEAGWPSAVAGPAVALTSVRVFDGSGLLEDATVVLRDGRIVAVGAGVSVPPGAEVRDASGHTLLPGLIDAHTHTFDRGALEAALRFGVTTELDQFTHAGFAAAMRAEQERGPVTDRADLFSAGTLATRAGGHGTQFGLPIPTVEGPGDAAAFVRDRKAEGSDWLKIIWEDGGPAGRAVPTHQPETVEALVEAARSNGLDAVVHVSRVDHARQASAMGAAGLVHAPWDRAPEPELADLLVENGTFVVPTLTVIRSVATGAEGDAQLGDDRLASLADGSLRATLVQPLAPRTEMEEAWEHAATLVRQLRERGGSILAGSDAPNPGTAHGLTLHRELELLVEAGLTPVEALRTATSAPADAFGLEDRGRIVPGMRADLVLVEGDPTARITDTRNLVAVWRNGAAVSFGGPSAVAGSPDPTRGADDPGAGAGAGAGTAEARQSGDPVPVPGPVSDFDDGTAAVAFGYGWISSTDRMAGGSSDAEVEAAGGVLRVRGTVRAGAPNTWSGAMFFPGRGPMAPADLSAGTGVRLRVRGQAPGFTVMLFSPAAGALPVVQRRPVSAEWRTVELPFSAFQGIDPAAVSAVFFGQVGQEGTYWIELDDVEIY